MFLLNFQIDSPKEFQSNDTKLDSMMVFVQYVSRNSALWYFHRKSFNAHTFQTHVKLFFMCKSRWFEIYCRSSACLGWRFCLAFSLWYRAQHEMQMWFFHWTKLNPKILLDFICKLERAFFISMAAGDFVTSWKFMHVSCWARERMEKSEIQYWFVFETWNFSCYSNTRQRLKLIRLRGVSERL
jgi:hypothetical protein